MLQDAVLSLAYIKVGINCASKGGFCSNLCGVSVPHASVTFSGQAVQTHIPYVLNVVCELAVSLRTSFTELCVSLLQKQQNFIPVKY